MRYLYEQAGAVSRVGVTATGPTVFEVFEGFYALQHQFVGALAAYVGNKAYAASVVLARLAFTPKRVFRLQPVHHVQIAPQGLFAKASPGEAKRPATLVAVGQQVKMPVEYLRIMVYI